MQIKYFIITTHISCVHNSNESSEDYMPKRSAQSEFIYINQQQNGNCHNVSKDCRFVGGCACVCVCVCTCMSVCNYIKIPTENAHFKRTSALNDNLTNFSKQVIKKSVFYLHY